MSLENIAISSIVDPCILGIQQNQASYRDAVSILANESMAVIPQRVFLWDHNALSEISSMSSEDICTALQSHQSEFSEWYRQSLEFASTELQIQLSHLKLRYMAILDFNSAKSRCDNRVCGYVGPVVVSSSHPAFRLQGFQIFVGMQTQRFKDHPLLLYGVGTGGDVAAGGVLGDIIRVAESLKGQ